MQSSVHWIIVCANGAAMSIKLNNSWLFWWCHPSSQLQWEFDSHSPPVRLIWWWFFAYRVHNQGERELSPQSQKRFWWFHLLCFSLTVLLVSLFFLVKEWRIIDVEKPLFGLFSSIQVGFGVEAVEAAAHCPKKIPSSPILCDWVSKPKFRTWRKVLKEEKWGIWSQMAKLLLLLVPKVVEVRVPCSSSIFFWASEHRKASRKNSSTLLFSSCCVFMAKSWISALAWCWQKWLSC